MHLRVRSSANRSPLTSPIPATSPSPGVFSIRSARSRRRRCAAMTSGPYSIKLPSSTRSATFSRAVRLPRRRRFATASGRAASSPPSWRSMTSVRSGRSRPVGSANAEEISGGGSVASSPESTGSPSDIKTSPTASVEPSTTAIDATTPSAGATTSWCIFIDSTSARAPPNRTASPGRANNATTVPCNSDTTSIVIASVYSTRPLSPEAVSLWAVCRSQPATKVSVGTW